MKFNFLKSSLPINRSLSSGQPVAQQPPEPKLEEKKDSEPKTVKKEIASPKAAPVSTPFQKVCSAIFQVMVIVAITLLFIKINKLESKEQIIGLLTSLPYLIFALCCIASCLYNLATGKSALGVANIALWVVLAIAVIAVLHKGVQERLPQVATRAASATSYAAPVNTTHTAPVPDFPDDSNSLGVGTHKFYLPNAGDETGWFKFKNYGLKRWDVDVSQCPHDSLLEIFSDGDTIKSWLGGDKPTWGKKLKLVALAPMDTAKIIVK